MTQRVISKPYVLRARDARVRDGKLAIELSSVVTVVVAIASLGPLWTNAPKAATENVSLWYNGHCLYWPELDEVIALDEWLPYALGIEPAAFLGRRNRGKKASPAKARAARKNGKKGGRPRKTAA